VVFVKVLKPYALFFAVVSEIRDNLEVPIIHVRRIFSVKRHRSDGSQGEERAPATRHLSRNSHPTSAPRSNTEGKGAQPDTRDSRSHLRALPGRARPELLSLLLALCRPAR